MDHGHMGRNEYPAVLLCRGKSEHVVILVDRASHGAQRIVTAGQDIGDGKTLHSGRPGGLDDADIGNVMGSQRVIFYSQMRRI